MTRTAPSAKKQVASSIGSKELEMSSFNNNKQSLLTVVKGKPDMPDKKTISAARETGLPSADKKSNNLTAEAGLSFVDNGGQASVTMETGLKSADKNNSVTMEMSQQQTGSSCSAKRGSPVTVETVTYEVWYYFFIRLHVSCYMLAQHIMCYLAYLLLCGCVLPLGSG